MPNHLLATLCLATASAAFAQQPAAPSRFVGTWEAKHEGVAFFTASIEASGSRISGKVTTLPIHADAEGKIVEMRQEPKEEGSIEKPVIAGNRLTFQVEESDGGIETYSITFTGGDTADLHIPDAPPSFPPFKLQRVKKR